MAKMDDRDGGSPSLEIVLLVTHAPERRLPEQESNRQSY